MILAPPALGLGGRHLYLQFIPTGVQSSDKLLLVAEMTRINMP